MSPADRRTFLKLAAAGGTGLLLVPNLLRVAHAAKPQGAPLIFSKYFKFEVKGIYNEVPGCTSVGGGTLRVMLLETTQDGGPGYRTYEYGERSYDNVTFSFRNSSENQDLVDWAQEALAVGGPGNALRRDCSLYLLARDKSSVLRTVDYFDCTPVMIQIGRKETLITVETPQIVEQERPLSKQLHGRTVPDADIRVEIDGRVVPAISTSGGDPSQDGDPSTGHNYVTELTLVTYVTPDDNTFSDAANAVANQGSNQRYTITITELAKDKSVIKTFVYDNCLLTSCDFPAVDAAGGEILARNSSWKPEILTVS